jgi:hypothetical protein
LNKLPNSTLEIYRNPFIHIKKELYNSLRVFSLLIEEPLSLHLITATMPDWRIYHSSGTFANPDEREQLSQAITSIYTRVGLPAFYVVVLFIEMPSGTMYRAAAPCVSAPKGSVSLEMLIISTK